jgi:fucose 4-O-acetylase-like acetyltransferase
MVHKGVRALEQNRNQQIDIVKGLGILTIVLAHNRIVLDTKGEIFSIVHSFALPLFFFLSGVFFRPELSLASVIKSKSDSILKPYFVTLLFLGIVFTLRGEAEFAPYILKMLYGTGGTIVWTPLWFLTNLFIVYLFGWFVITVFHKPIENQWIKCAFLCTMLSVGVKYIDFFWQKEVSLFQHDFTIPGLPFSVDIVPISASFFLLGYFLKRHTINFKPRLILTITAILVFVSLHLFFNKSIDLNLRIYDGVVIPTLEALSGIYITFSLSYLIHFRAGIARLMAYTGSASLFILIFHVYFQDKAFAIAASHLGSANIPSAIFAFSIGSIIPVAIWFAVSKIDLLAIFYLPMKSNKLLQRISASSTEKIG